MKMFFSKTRAREHLRKLNREKHELTGPVVSREDTKARVQWLNARLALAQKRDDREEVERLAPLCLEAREEFKASHSSLSS